MSVDYKELLRTDRPVLNVQEALERQLHESDTAWRDEVIYWRAENTRLKNLLANLVTTINEEIDP
jgi:hypothetical protein|tara:strand:+ start:540 stop:734 length:195 start_codon:yes stop_codon:yes gene_type:complete